MLAKDLYYIEGLLTCNYLSAVQIPIKNGNAEKSLLYFGLDTISTVADSEITNPNSELALKLQNKELYFLKKAAKVKKITYPIKVSSFISDNQQELIIDDITVDDNDNVTRITKHGLNIEQSLTTNKLTDNITHILLNMNKTIDDNFISINKNKININELQNIINSEKTTIKVRIEFQSTFSNNILKIYGTLTQLNIAVSQMAKLYIEIKDKNDQYKNNKNNEHDINNIKIHKYSKKKRDVRNNIVDLLTNN